MIEFSLESYSLWLNQHPNWILGSLFLAAFVESLAIAGIIVPGVAILFGIAAVAGGADVPLLYALAAAMIGAVFGDVLSFYLGYHYQDRLKTLWPVSKFPDAIASGTRFFQEYGGLSVVVGRFVGPIRPVLPLVAGMMGMSPARFVSINLLSALAWAPVYVLPGYLVGAAVNVSPPEHWLSLLGGLSISIILLSFLFRHASKRLQRGENWYDYLHHQGLFGSHHPHEKPFASLLLLIVSATFFCIWTSMHLHYSLLSSLDEKWLDFAMSLNLEPLRHSFILITSLGDERFLQISFTIAVLTLIAARQFGAGVLLASAGIAISLITHGLKAYFEVTRPEVLANSLTSFAFPSGHSSGAMVLYGMIATLIAERSQPQSRWKIYLLLAMPAILIALSRVLLGVHWFSDVIAGLSTGLAVCSIARIAYWYLSTHAIGNQNVNPAAIPRKIWLSGLGVWIISAVLYVSLLWEQQISQYALETFSTLN